MPPSDAPPPSRLRITATCVIDPDEIEWRFTPSGGPGGQHANKASTRAEARFDVVASRSLTDRQRALLLERLGEVVAVSVDDTRSQARNRALALERLVERLAQGLARPRARKPTSVSKAAVERRLDDKKRRSETKRARSRRVLDD